MRTGWVHDRPVTDRAIEVWPSVVKCVADRAIEVWSYVVKCVADRAIEV